MSDFLYTSLRGKGAQLKAAIEPIYQNYNTTITVYEGAWGSLAVSESPYSGFQPYETDHYICCVLGGPVLNYTNNRISKDGAASAGTQALAEKHLSAKLDWSKDVSGPFVFLLINKKDKTVTCTTDLMLFIPVYCYEGENEGITFGSHVDAVARAAGQTDNIDNVSIADFILNGIVTFPFTVFSKIKQLEPATEYNIEALCLDSDSFDVQSKTQYWLPEEVYKFKTIDDAAEELRNGLLRHVNLITKEMESVGQFISGGEDSRVLSGLLPERLEREAYIFVDSMNREARVAEKVANRYGARFTPKFRDPLHYLDILDEASALVGTGHQYIHCHSLQFDRELELKKLSAVFGGYLSDSLLKGAYCHKSLVRSKLHFLPEKQLPGEARSTAIVNDSFSPNLLNELNRRRNAHVERVRAFRPESVHEWFVLWPATMRVAISNHYCNRRLFSSYEVFMSHEVVKLSAAIPTSWKLNRNIFHKAFRQNLLKSKWLRHSDGRLPYFSQRMNRPLILAGFFEKFLRKANFIKGNPGPWNDWRVVFDDKQWQSLLAFTLDKLEDGKIMKNSIPNELTAQQQINIVNLSAKLLSLTPSDRLAGNSGHVS